MTILDFKIKLKNIIESYLIYIGYKMAFIKDEELTDQINHRKEQCQDCILNRYGWCSKKRVTAIINDDGLFKSVRGCSCWLKAKFFSQYKKNICPMNKWEK